MNEDDVQRMKALQFASERRAQRSERSPRSYGVREVDYATDEQLLAVLRERGVYAGAYVKNRKDKIVLVTEIGWGRKPHSQTAVPPHFYVTGLRVDDTTGPDGAQTMIKFDVAANGGLRPLQ